MKYLLAALVLAMSSPTIAAQLLVLNKADATLAFVDPQSGVTRATVPTGVGPHEIELSTDGKFAFVSNYGTNTPGNSLSIVDVSARRESKRVDLGELQRPHGLTFTNGQLYFTAEQSQRVGRLDPATARVEWTFPTEQQGTHMVLAARDGTRLFTSNISSNTVGIFERSSNDWTQTLVSVGAGPEGLDQSPDGRELWSAHSRDGAISIIDLASKKVTQTVDAKTRRSNRLKFTNDGALVLVSDLGAGELVIIDARKRTQLKRLALGRAPTGILIPPGGEVAYVALSGENKIAVIDLKSLTVAKSIETGGSPDGMAWAR